jgi:predicted MFS family arabinose efflux permease
VSRRVSIAKTAACAAGLNIGFGALSYVALTIGVLVDGYGFSIERAALLGTIELGAMALTSLALTPAAAAANLGRLAFWGALVSGLGNISTAWAEGFTIVLLTRLIAGVGAGVVAPLVNVAFSASRQPVKLYANAMLSFMVVSALFYLVVPLIYSRLSYPAYFMAYGGMFLLTAPLLLWLGGRPAAVDHPAETVGSYPLGAAVLTAAGAFTIWLGYSVVWSFCERIASSLGMSPAAIGQVFSLALIIGLVGTLVASRAGDRYGVVWPVSIGGLCMGLAYLGVTMAPTALFYTISMYGFGIVLLFFMPYLIGFCAAIDASGRLAAAVSGLMPIAAACGPLVGGLILASGSYATLGIFGFCCALLFCIGAWAAFALRGGRQPPSASALKQRG